MAFGPDHHRWLSLLTVMLLGVTFGQSEGSQNEHEDKKKDCRWYRSARAYQKGRAA